jgi:DNA-binding CsgD family transcriptional regulator
MEDVTREAVGDIVRSALERVRRGGAMLPADSPAARELSIAQHLLDAALQSITGEVSLPNDPTPDGDAVHRLGNTSNALLIPPLTLREEEVLRLMADGLRNKEIAARLSISERTATFHVGNVLSKLGADGRVEAIVIARRNGLL